MGGNQESSLPLCQPLMALNSSSEGMYSVGTGLSGPVREVYPSLILFLSLGTHQAEIKGPRLPGHGDGALGQQPGANQD